MGVEAMVDPEIAAALELEPPRFDWTGIEPSSVPGLREAVAASRPPVVAVPTTTTHRDVVVQGGEGSSGLTLRIYEPAGTETGRACLYWVHGGGYITGSALVEEPRLDRWAETFGIVIVSVDYRLAPEFPFPAPFDDCVAGLDWVASHTDELGVDRNRLMVGGASAGGGLAAAVVLAARDRGQVPVSFQLLLYPMLDDRRTTISSQMIVPVWTTEANRVGWDAYLAGAAGGEDVSEYAAPARVKDVAGLPPTFICVGGADLFRDEDVVYATRLTEAGISTELHVYPGGTHAFERLSEYSSLARSCQAEIDDALRRAVRDSAAV